VEHVTSKLMAVVIRQLEGHPPVISTVIPPCNNKLIDDQKEYLVNKIEEYIKKFENDFIEFKEVNWYTNFIDLETNTVVFRGEYLRSN